MNLITHALTGWSLASALPSLSRREKAWIVGAALAPDLDGLGIIAEIATRHTAEPLYWWSEYHHVLAHNLLFATLISLAAWAFTRRPAVATLVFASAHLHLLGDLLGSRGPDGYSWPIPYLWPFSDAVSLSVPFQWELNAWPNVAISLLLLAHLFWLAWKRGMSPLELVSERANSAFVEALRGRIRRSRKRGNSDA